MSGYGTWYIGRSSALRNFTRLNLFALDGKLRAILLGDLTGKPWKSILSGIRSYSRYSVLWNCLSAEEFQAHTPIVLLDAKTHKFDLGAYISITRVVWSQSTSKF
jgi:hypothetical protein